MKFPETAHDRKRALSGGVFAGGAAGMGLTLMMTLMSLAGGKDVWYGMKGAAAPFLGERAMQPGFDLLSVWMGLVSHLAVSVIWGVMFGFLFYGIASRGLTMLAGAAWGVVVWLGMFYLVLPISGLSAMAAEAPIVKNIVYHELFGLGVAGFYLLSRRFVMPEARGTKRTAARRFVPAHVH